jgi:fructose-bisphosphate aldolase class I
MAAEKAKAIITAIDIDGDKDLTKEELVQFFEGLKKAVGDDAPTRSSDEEAAQLIEQMGEGGKLTADKFQAFLVGFCEAEPEKVELILRGMAALDRQKLFDAHMARVKSFDGFLAALDQSGGSTPKALKAYGQDEDWTDREAEMFDAVHAMRSRIVESPAFSGEAGILGAILFEMTMDREFAGVSAPKWLWETKQVVPFVKCDKGLMDEADGVQLMKPNPGLDNLTVKAYSLGVFGTKMRSNINHANESGIKAIVEQQFEVAKQIIGHGLCPIIEPEVNINSETKSEAEDMLKKYILEELNKLDETQDVMLKLTIPTTADLYKDCADHPRVVKVVALSGGYDREKANALLKKNHSMVASFSRALMEGVSYGMTEDEFNTALGSSITSIFDASKEANKE